MPLKISEVIFYRLDAGQIMSKGKIGTCLEDHVGIRYPEVHRGFVINVNKLLSVEACDLWHAIIY